MADKRGEGERWVESNSTITKAVPVQLTPSISTQQSSLRQRQDQLAREKESKKAVLLDTPPVTGKSGRTGIKKPPQPRPASVPTSSSTTASSTPTPTTHPDNLAHLKARLVQLLALKSVEASESASKLNAHPQDIQYLLNQVAYSQKSIQSSNPIFHLKHELWNDIEVDDWREYSDAEKQQVAAAVKRKTGKISQCIAGTIAPSNDKEKEKATTKKAAPAKTRQNLLRASQGKKVSRSPSPAKAMLNAKDASSSNTKDKDKEKEKEKEKEKDKDAQSSTSSRSPSVMSTHSSSTASKESSSKRKREDEAVKAARSTTAAQPKSESSKRMKKDESTTKSKQRNKVDYTSSEDSTTPPPPPKPKLKGLDKRLNDDENYRQLHQQYSSAMNTLQTQHALYKGEYQGTHQFPTMLLGEGAIQALVIGVNQMHNQLNDIRNKHSQSQSQSNGQ